MFDKAWPMGFVSATRTVMVGLTLGTLLGCGAKTGLLIPDASLMVDAGVDAGPDAGPDADMCLPRPVVLQRRGAQVMLVTDRSNSMNDPIEGSGGVGPSRWDVLAEVLGEVLAESDPLIELGAKFYPSTVGDPTTPMEACSVDPGVDLLPARGNADRLLRFFSDTGPNGGTPTAGGLQAVQEFFESRPAPFVPRFVILATDGGPNCNPFPDVPPGMCVCTGAPQQCDPRLPPDGAGEYAAYNCLDESNTLSVIRSLFGDLEIPVYVIGIDDRTRPDLGDVLDRMAIEGGRPREDGAGRRFYSVAEADDLRDALTAITNSISRCAFTLTPAPTADATVDVRIGDLVVPRDPTRAEGWDFTNPSRSEMTIFGGACERVSAGDEEVTAEILCPE